MHEQSETRFSRPEKLAKLCFLGTAEGQTSCPSFRTPQLGLSTISLADTVSLVELIDPEFDPASLKAQEGHMIMLPAETTEEALVRFGFGLKRNGPLQ